ncbi:MAG: AraC family transcriptional regulator, partial [Pseudomonadota bacterium]
GQLHVCHRHVAGRHTSLNALQYGGSVEIDPGQLESFYLVQIPLAGGAQIDHCGRALSANANAGTVLNPDRPTRMTWHAGCQKVLLQVDKSFLESIAESQLGHCLPGAIRFDPDLCFDSASARSLRAEILACVQDIDGGALFNGCDTERDRLTECRLASALIWHHRINISHMLERASVACTSRVVKRAVEYIHAHLGGALDATRIAAEVGVSVRALQKGFQTHLGQSPMRYVKSARLDYAHYLLRQDGPSLRVTDAALRAGFTHFGRFAGEYKARFACSPSAECRSR